jgi:hypothetical protein
MQPYPQPPQQQQYYPQQQQMMMQQPQYAMQQPPAKKRNPALIAIGAILFVIGSLAFLVFAYNAWQYSTVEDRFADLGSSGKFVIDIVKEADMRRMMIFGPIAALFGGGGLVLGLLGLRKR